MLSTLSLLAALISLAPQDSAAKPAPAAPVAIGTSEEEFKAVHEQDEDEDEAPKPAGVEVTLSSGAKAYLALPPAPSKDAKAPLPAVLVLHEAWGMTSHVRHWADRLAACGYAALAVDFYGGKIANSPAAAMAAEKSVDDATALKHLKAAHEFLKTDPRVKATKIGAIGWSFGGGKALQAAIEIEDLQACVVYYGVPVTDPVALKKIKAPICGVFADQDFAISTKSVDEFEAALTDAKVEHEIHRYDGPHGFTNPGSMGYRPKDAAAAWDVVSKFLAAKLK